MSESINSIESLQQDFKKQQLLREKLHKFFRKQGAYFQPDDIGEFLSSKDEFILDITLRKIGALGIKSNFTVVKGFVDHASSIVRAAAANAFGQIMDRRAVPHLEKMSTDSSYLVNWEAIIALSNIGTKEANPVFIKSLKDPHPTIRMLSARALGQNPEIESLGQLLKAAGDTNKAVRAAVIESLGKANYFPAFSLIEEAITDSDPEVRSVAIMAISNFPQQRLLRYFKQSIKDYSDSVRIATIKALELLGYAESLPVLESVINDRSATIRQAVIKSLGEIGSFEQTQTIAPFLHDKSPKVRAEAATALGKLGYAESTQNLLKAVKDSNKHVRSAAASALCLINEQFEINLNIASSHFNIHLQNLESGDLLTRENAIRNLCYKGVSFAVEPLIEAAKDASIEIRRLAIKALALVRNKRTFSTIHKSLGDPCLRVKWESVYNLDLYSDMIKLADIIRLFFDPEPSIRLKCAQILEYNKSPEALDTLIKGINDSDVAVRRAIVKAICSFDLPEVIPPLKQVLVDKVPEIGCMAAIKLGEMNVPDGSSLIIESMRGNDLVLCRRALQVAVLLKTPFFLRQAVKLASYENFDIRRLAMLYISMHAEQQILKSIKALLAKEMDADIIMLGLNAYGCVKSAESLDYLKDYAEHENISIRKCALKNILKMNIPQTQKESLIAIIFKDYDDNFRQEILSSINVILEKNGKEFLLNMIDKSPTNIAEQAVSMLQHYPGTDTEEYLTSLIKSKKGRIGDAATETLKKMGYGFFKLFSIKYLN